MASPAEIAAVRFGYGLSARGGGPADAASVLAGLSAPDTLPARFPIDAVALAADQLHRFRPLKRAADKKEPGAKEAFAALRGEIQDSAARGFAATLARAVEGQGFRERLQFFWADHFTARSKSIRLAAAAPAYLEEAIRPHIGGRFSDMLKAAITHPLMIVYLDQVTSTGPNAQHAGRKGLGLNENLAREVLELHTLGVGGHYKQVDVRQFALLLTGLTFGAEDGVQFKPERAEPGAETVLGKAYGGARRARIEEVFAFLDDLAVHPDTARHIAGKLVTHFISDTPDPALVAAVASAWRDTGGNLPDVYAALLSHPAAWEATGAKARQPFDFVVAALRALEIGGDAIAGMKRNRLAGLFAAPLRRMGQPFMEPDGPDGWPEEAEAWITPQGLAARIDWAMAAPAELRPMLPDPRVFVQTALGSRAGARTVWAAGAAETRAEGVGIILASPEFNRR